MKHSSILNHILALILLTSCNGNTISQRQPEKVKTMKVTPTTSADTRGYSGTIEEINGANLSFAAIGTIQSLPVSEGQMVRKGQLLGLLDATTAGNMLTSATAMTRQAETLLAQAEDAHARMKKLHDAGSLPEIKWVEAESQLSQARQAVEQARAAERIAGKSNADTRLTAPFSGYIAQKSAEAGQNTAAGMTVLKLVKIDRVKVKISVPEDEISKISQGQQVSVIVDALDGQQFTAVVSERGVSADPLTRSYEVKAIIENTDHKLLPGMVCAAFTNSESAASMILLPANIIQIDSDNRRFVWLAADGKAKKQYVETGRNVGDNVVIESGLSTGDEVITVGQQKVSAGMEVEILKN